MMGKIGLDDAHGYPNVHCQDMLLYLQFIIIKLFTIARTCKQHRCPLG